MSDQYRHRYVVTVLNDSPLDRSVTIKNAIKRNDPHTNRPPDGLTQVEVERHQAPKWFDGCPYCHQPLEEDGMER